MTIQHTDRFNDLVLYFFVFGGPLPFGREIDSTPKRLNLSTWRSCTQEHQIIDWDCNDKKSYSKSRIDCLSDGVALVTWRNRREIGHFESYKLAKHYFLRVDKVGSEEKFERCVTRCPEQIVWH
jgi:hypothetical protein